MAIIHTNDCVRFQEEERADIAKFEAMYPNYCRGCNGTGVINDDDPSVGIFYNPVPCDYCEGRSFVSENGERSVCALCMQPGDFSGRTYENDDADRRPCDCPTEVSAPEGIGCICPAGVPEPLTRRAAVERVDESADTYNYAADDLAFDAARERATFGRSLGRD